MSTLFAFDASLVPQAHTVVAGLAFATALFMGWASGLWKDLCENAVSAWPVEWFPSVSATIGDHAPSRSPFQILIALCATPRFLLLLIQWLVHRYPRPRKETSRHDGSSPEGESNGVAAGSTIKGVLDGIDGAVKDSVEKGTEGAPDVARTADASFIVGIARTLCCGGWVYITSRDHHDIHDLFMITYLVLTLPWMSLNIRGSPKASSRRRRQIFFYGFLSMIPFVIWTYYRHSVLRIPGAYTQYAFFEWSLVFWDVAFDAVAMTEMGHIRIVIIDTSRTDENDKQSNGQNGVYLQPIARVPTSTRLTDWTATPNLDVRLPYWDVLAWINDVYFALAGPELALLANTSGYLLGLPGIREFATSREGLITNRILTVIGGMGWYFLPSPGLRLVGVSIGTSCGWLAMYGNWARMKGSREMLAEGKTLSLVEYACRPAQLFPAPPIPEVQAKGHSPIASPTRAQQTGITLGLGALIHLIQTFVNDAGTVIAWTWTGYPIKGPTLHPFAGLVIAAAAVGLIADLNTVAFDILGCIGAYILYAYPDWTGFFGGLILVFYLMAVSPRILVAASACSPGSTFGNALLLNCILDVVSVVTAAYAFVPYGHLVRERTDLVLSFSMACVVLGSVMSRRIPLPGSNRLHLRSRVRLATISRWTILASATLSVLAIALSYSKMPISLPVSYYPYHRILSGGIWAVHFGVDESGRDSQRRIMELLRDMQVDIVGLLETDLHRFVYGNRDVTRLISEELGYYVDLGPGPNKHTWGAALLSKFPIINSIHHLLPSPHGELAPAIHATLDVHGEKVNVLVSHNGQEEDALDRELQTTEIARLLRETEDVPTIFLGYLVTHPHDPRPWPYQILMEDGRMSDIEIDDRRRWCEYIAFRGLWRIGFARLHESDISDTELQVGKFVLPKPGEKVVYESDREMYWHIGENDIPEPWRMPGMFRGKGTRGHTYRVWDGPLYYMPPERSGLQRYGWRWNVSLG